MMTLVKSKHVLFKKVCTIFRGSAYNTFRFRGKDLSLKKFTSPILCRMNWKNEQKAIDCFLLVLNKHVEKMLCDKQIFSYTANF